MREAGVRRRFFRASLAPSGDRDIRWTAILKRPPWEARRQHPVASQNAEGVLFDSRDAVARSGSTRGNLVAHGMCCRKDGPDASGFLADQSVPGFIMDGVLRNDLLVGLN